MAKTRTIPKKEKFSNCHAKAVILLIISSKIIEIFSRSFFQNVQESS